MRLNHIGSEGPGVAACANASRVARSVIVATTAFRRPCDLPTLPDSHHSGDNARTDDSTHDDASSCFPSYRENSVHNGNIATEYVQNIVIVGGHERLVGDSAFRRPSPST